MEFRKGKAVKPFDHPAELNIHFKGRITYKDYRNLILGATFKGPVYIVIVGGAILSILLTVLVGVNSLGSISFPIIPFGLLIYVPIHTIAAAKRLYKTNQLFQEELTYRLDNYGIHLKGEAVDSTQSWSHFYKIKETKHFFMLYRGEMELTLLDKKMIAPTDVITFQRFIKLLNVR